MGFIKLESNQPVVMMNSIWRDFVLKQYLLKLINLEKQEKKQIKLKLIYGIFYMFKKINNIKK